MRRRRELCCAVTVFRPNCCTVLRDVTYHSLSRRDYNLAGFARYYIRSIQFSYIHTAAWLRRSRMNRRRSAAAGETLRLRPLMCLCAGTRYRILHSTRYKICLLRRVRSDKKAIKKAPIRAGINTSKSICARKKVPGTWYTVKV